MRATRVVNPKDSPTLVRVPESDSRWTFRDEAFGSTVAPSSGDPATDSPITTSSDFASRYVARDMLGEGGMGLVRLVSDVRIGRDVAMKTMRVERRSLSDYAGRFLREACVQGQLEHPAIVPVYDVGADPSHVPFFTMKRVVGATFAEIVTRLAAGELDAVQKYTRHKLLAAFASVCQAIDFAHARGVVHRDLKPSNVMLGDFGEVYVLDWGVAKILATRDDPASGRSSVATSPSGARTIAGVAMGTPGYMAPEQARGDADIDGRADVYALGSILFELLALSPLHPQRDVDALLVSALRAVDARPSVRAPGAGIPPELDAICVRACAFERKERFTTVRDMLDALERFLEGDRDLERRRELGEVHARAAREAAEAALGRDEPDARRRALQEVGRALALDPENRAATETLVRLLVAPPAAVPPDAQAAMSASARATERATARGALVGYLAWFAFVPFGFWMGVRSVPLAVASGVAWAAAAASAHVALRHAGAARWPRALAMVATSSAAAVTSAICGPYVLVPTLAVINVILWLLVSGRAWRPLIVALGALSVLAPAALDWAHVIRFYHFRDRRVTILQGLLDFTPVATHALLLAASLALVAVAALLVTRFRDHLDDAERRLHLQAWQLEQLVPRASEALRRR